MWAKRIGKVLMIVAIVTLTLCSLAVIATIVLDKKIKEAVTTEINQQVTVPVSVNGGIELSLFRHFPQASLNFYKVSIPDKLSKGRQELLNAEEISLMCNIFSLFSNKIEFDKILIRNGSVNARKNAKGQVNWDILKPAGGNANEQTIQLKKAEVRNVKVRYRDEVAQVNLHTEVKQIVLRGNFSDSDFAMATQTNFKVLKLTIGNDEILSDRNITTDIDLYVNLRKHLYQLNSGNLSVDGSSFEVKGDVTNLKNGSNINVELSNKGTDIQHLLGLIPARYKENFAGADGTGEYQINASVKGLLSANTWPDVTVQVLLKNGSIKLSKYNKELQSVNTNIQFTSNKNGDNRLSIEPFSCKLNNAPFKFSLLLNNLQHPDFKFKADGTLFLAELRSFIPDTLLQDLEGSIAFNNFELIGNVDDFNRVEGSTLNGMGTFQLNEIEFRQNGITYGNIGGTLQYSEQIIHAKNFTLNFLGTDFTFTGSIENLFPYVYNLSVKRSANNIVLGVNGNVAVKQFNLTAILDAYDKKNRPAVQQREKINIRDIFNMKGNLDIALGKFMFRKMQFDQLNTNVQLAPGAIRIVDLSTNTMKGQLKAAGQINFTPDNSLNIVCDIRAIELSIPDIFNDCENFGQQTLTGKHLLGTVSTAVSFNATWKDYKVLDDKNLTAIVDFTIKNGELIGFEPLRAASKFIKMEELERIRFSELSNTIKIANRRIDIPEFEIKSSALNLVVFGFHHFDNVVDYHFKINLHKLLAQKFKRKSSEFQYVEPDPYEGINLYLSMSGPIDNPTIKLDKSITRNKIKDDFKREKQELKNLFNNSPVFNNSEERRREDKYFNTTEEPQFIDLPDE